jgi:hypothetical protein
MIQTNTFVNHVDPCLSDVSVNTTVSEIQHLLKIASLQKEEGTTAVLSFTVHLHDETSMNVTVGRSATLRVLFKAIQDQIMTKKTPPMTKTRAISW